MGLKQKVTTLYLPKGALTRRDTEDIFIQITPNIYYPNKFQYIS
jgi:hypothetical protein